MKTTRLPPANCPACGKILDACTSVEPDRQPSPGDLTICAHCIEILKFNEDLRPVTLTLQETRAIQPEEWRLLNVAKAQIKKAWGL